MPIPIERITLKTHELPNNIPYPDKTDLLNFCDATNTTNVLFYFREYTKRPDVQLDMFPKRSENTDGKFTK